MTKKAQGYKPYGNTRVEVAVTQHRDITGLFAKYGVERWTFATDKVEGFATVRFEMEPGRWVRVTLRVRADEGAGADMRRKTKWRNLLGSWNLQVDGYPGAPHPMSGLVSFGSALSAKATSSFEGLLSLVTTGYLTQSKGASVEVSRHANCKCAIVDDVKDELE